MRTCLQCGDHSEEHEPMCSWCKRSRVGINGRGEISPITIAVDMDGVLTDFRKKYFELKSNDLEWPQCQPGFFANLEPIPGAIEGFKYLWDNFDAYILTRPMVVNVDSYKEKAIWIREHFGLDVLHKLALNPQKQRNKGHFLIDDTTDAGQIEFEGILLKFGPDHHDWNSIKEFFKNVSKVYHVV